MPDVIIPAAVPTELGQIFDLESRRVVVSGAASGLGRAVAQSFAFLGASVVGLDKDAEGLESVMIATDAARGSFLPCVCDVSDGAGVSEAMGTAIDHLSHLDALLHFAGISGPLASLVDQSEADWDRVLDTNLRSAFLLCRASVPMFGADSIGKIVLTASTWGVVGSRRASVTPYAASKAGIVGFGAQLAMELAPHVNVNTIVPAGVRSAIADGFYDNPAAVETLIGDLPVGRIREADAVIGLCVLLSTSASDHMTGALIPIDGGFLAH